MINKREVRETLRQYNIRPSKRLGQNFLIDSNIKDKIIAALKLTEQDMIIEIGPGLGSLTEPICQKAKKVIAIEKDRRLCEFLKERLQCFRNLEIVCGDFLKFYLPDHKSKVVGNLPFYITTPILTKLINERKKVSSAFISVQKEFAERLVAKPGQPTYSPITLFVQFYCLPKPHFSIKPTSFFPPPEVGTIFLSLEIRKEPAFLIKNEAKLFRIIRAAFEKRRKTILNSLVSADLWATKAEVLDALKNSGISPLCRPEDISMEGFVKISSFLGIDFSG